MLFEHYFGIVLNSTNVFNAFHTQSSRNPVILQRSHIKLKSYN